MNRTARVVTLVFVSLDEENDEQRFLENARLLQSVAKVNLDMQVGVVATSETNIEIMREALRHADVYVDLEDMYKELVRG